MNKKETLQRGAQGKHTAAAEKRMAQQVTDLFRVNAVFVLRVEDYRHMPEKDKRFICDLFREITLCKVPERKGDTMYFYLRKEGVR